MKKKSLIIITACLLVALLVAAVGVGFAWYTNTVSIDNQLELDADGFLVVYFEENSYTLSALKPAVAKPDAVKNNEEFNVLQEGGNILEKAQTAEKKESVFRYLNESDKQSQEAQIDVSCEAYLVFADGSKEKLSLVYDLCVKVDITWKYIVKTPAEGEGGENTAAAAENGTNSFSIDVDDWKITQKTRFDVTGSADFSMDTLIYFRQVDDLCDPRIREAKSIVVTIKVAVTPDVDEEQETTN